MVVAKISFSVKDTHRKKTYSGETPGLTNNMNMGIWVVVTFNQLFISS